MPSSPLPALPAPHLGSCHTPRQPPTRGSLDCCRGTPRAAAPTPAPTPSVRQTAPHVPAAGAEESRQGAARRQVAAAQRHSQPGPRPGPRTQLVALNLVPRTTGQPAWKLNASFFLPEGSMGVGRSSSARCLLGARQHQLTQATKWLSCRLCRCWAARCCARCCQPPMPPAPRTVWLEVVEQHSVACRGEGGNSKRRLAAGSRLPAGGARASTGRRRAWHQQQRVPSAPAYPSSASPPPP